jgi:hypothetical protein
MKYHTKVGVQIECGLLMKGVNEQLIKKAIDDTLVERYHRRKKNN